MNFWTVKAVNYRKPGIFLDNLDVHRSLSLKCKKILILVGVAAVVLLLLVFLRPIFDNSVAEQGIKCQQWNSTPENTSSQSKSGSKAKPANDFVCHYCVKQQIPAINTRPLSKSVSKFTLKVSGSFADNITGNYTDNVLFEFTMTKVRKHESDWLPQYRDSFKIPKFMMTTDYDYEFIHGSQKVSRDDFLFIIRDFPYNIVNLKLQKLGSTALHEACKANDVETIDSLIAAGASVNQVSNEGDTPLHYAVRFGSRAAVGALLKSCASPTVKNNDGMSPISIAVEQCKSTVQQQKQLCSNETITMLYSATYNKTLS